MRFTAGYAALEVENLLEDEQAKDAFAHFGLAIHVSNVVEHAIVNALFIFEMLPTIQSYKSKEECGNAVDKFFDGEFSLTFGNLLKQQLGKRELSGDLVEMLESSKIVRNHLVHHFQRESSELFFIRKGRVSIIEQCQHAIALFKQTDADLELEMLPIRGKLGFDEEWLARTTEVGMREMLAMADEE